MEKKNRKLCLDTVQDMVCADPRINLIYFCATSSYYKFHVFKAVGRLQMMHKL